MASWGFHDGNIHDLLTRRYVESRLDVSRSLQIHSALIRRLSQDKTLEGHQGCVNSVSWNSSGSRLISGSDDTRINVWSYPSGGLLNSIETGHSANIFCTKFVPETFDELVVSGAGDAEVRLFNLSRSNSDRSISPSALYQCHTRRVKKLAVEIGNPNVVWSASEDGTLRQHDFRVGTSCPPAGSSHQECHNVLLDLRCGAKSSLADPPRHTLMLKTCDISASRPHLLLVGGSDAFARLYDRRMLPALSSCPRKMSAPPCVNYFCPMHLSDRGHSSLHLTHATFSPDGEEVLLSYGGEHVYLMDVSQAGGNAIRYTPADVSKLTSFSPTVNGVISASDVLQNNQYKGRNTVQLEKCNKLIQIAQGCLDGQKNYHYGIEACNEVLDGYGCNIGPILEYECLCLRAALLLKRKWKNDVHMAVRDCCKARSIKSSCFKAQYYMSEALSQLNLRKEALEFAYAAQILAPSNCMVAERVETAKKELATGESKKQNEGKHGALGSEPRGGRSLSLTDIIFPADASSDASHDGPRSDGEDSDYDEEMELDFETSMSGDDEHDNEPNALHGSSNSRTHRIGDSALDSGGPNGSCGSPSSSSSNNDRVYQPEAGIDMRQRYVGHCNVGTDIKQASFLGQRGEYIASGSDDGRWFIWEKLTGRLIKMLDGDESVVNCVQCHPFDCAVATSGIDDTIKIWTPTASEPSIVASGSIGPVTDDVLVSVERNQQRLSRSREPFLGIEILERFRVHEFDEGSLHPFECAQS